MYSLCTRIVAQCIVIVNVYDTIATTYQIMLYDTISRYTNVDDAHVLSYAC